MKRVQRTCGIYGAMLDKVWPIFFWQACVICKKEFRREYIWEHIELKSPNHITRHVCLECCPTDEDALRAVEEYVEDYRQRMKKYEALNILNSFKAPPPGCVKKGI